MARRSVLLVEDDPDVRAFFAEVLQDQGGCSVTEVGTGEEALALLRGGARFDLLFTDVRMPGKLNGFELAGEARRLDARIKICCVTGYAEMEQQRSICDALLHKPFRMEVLIGVVTTLLNSRG